MRVVYNMLLLLSLDTSESDQDVTIKVEKNGKVYVNGHKVVEKDVLAANGRIDAI